MEELWLIWKEPLTRRRYKIGTLLKEKDNYKFNYINPELDEAKNVGFNYYPGFEDLKKTYESKTLFTNISTRLPNVNRPDYLELLNCYNLNIHSSEFEILKATKGRSITDSYEFVLPFSSNKLQFDVAGTRHCKDIDKCKNLLKINKKIYLEPDTTNNTDKNAIKVIYKENGTNYHLGYVPRYYSKELLEELNKGINYSAMIESVNFETQLYDEIINVKLIFN